MTISPRTVVSVATAAFVLVGCVIVSLIVVGYVELKPSRQYLGIDGMAEVLLILGIYFLIPYTFLLACGLLTFFRVGSKLTESESTRLWLRGMQAMLVVAYVTQQTFTNMYIVEFRSVSFMLLFLVIDVVVPVVYVLPLFKTSPLASYMYTASYGVKLALLWDVVARMSSDDPRFVYGPNGMRVMLFLCLPVVQLPVYINMLERGVSILEAFTQHMNAVLGHLLHSIDMFAIYEIAFVPGSCPDSVHNLLCLLMTLAFLANNLCFVSLFHRSQQLQERRAVVMAGTREYDPVGGGADAALTTDHKRLEFRVVLFLLLLALFVDLPFFIARFVMWYLNNVQLSLFIVKDGKNLLDVALIVSRNAVLTKYVRDKFQWWQ